MMRVLSLAWVVPVALILGGCGGDESPQGGAPPAHAQGPQSKGPRSQGPESRRPSGPPVTVAVEAAAVRPMSSYYAATASLEPNKEAEVLARVAGVVISIPAEEGDRVKQGAVLLRIQDEEFVYRMRQAEAEAAKQETRFGRMQKMFEGNLISAEEFDTAQNDLRAAEAARDLAKLELSYTRVEAPFSGHIVRRLVDPGQTVNNGTPLFTLADMSPLLARVHVPAKEFREIQTDQPVELQLDSNDRILAGTIILVSPIIDPTSGTIKVTVEVPEYPADTRPGDFAEVRIVTARHAEALTVPRGAVFTDRGDLVVYVAADSTAERRVVEVGFEDDTHREIVNGLRAGERVVVQGQRSLKPGSPIQIKDRLEFEDAASRSEGS